jgi:D-alanyl-D-alanine-carboxypeptidase/D-alanyl-D-alanine-endopeptidase
MPSNIEENAAVARNLRLQRKHKGLTQEQLSESSGVAIRTIQRIENAKVEPHLQTLSLLAQSLDIELQELTYDEAADEAISSETAIRKWLLIFHLLPVVGVIIPFANLILPLILWAYKRDEHPLFEEHGRAVINFHLTLTLTFMLGIVLLVLLFHLGLLLLLVKAAYALILIFWNANKIIRDRGYKYPLSIRFL